MTDFIDKEKLFIVFTGCLLASLAGALVGTSSASNPEEKCVVLDQGQIDLLASAGGSMGNLNICDLD